MRLRVGVVAKVSLVETGVGEIRDRQLLNTAEEGTSGCVFYNQLVLEGI